MARSASDLVLLFYYVNGSPPQLKFLRSALLSAKGLSQVDLVFLLARLLSPKFFASSFSSQCAYVRTVYMCLSPDKVRTYGRILSHCVCVMSVTRRETDMAGSSERASSIFTPFFEQLWISLSASFTAPLRA